MNIWFLGYFDKSATTIVNTYKDWILIFLNNPKNFQVFIVIIVELQNSKMVKSIDHILFQMTESLLWIKIAEWFCVWG